MDGQGVLWTSDREGLVGYPPEGEPIHSCSGSWSPSVVDGHLVIRSPSEGSFGVLNDTGEWLMVRADAATSDVSFCGAGCCSRWPPMIAMRFRPMPPCSRSEVSTPGGRRGRCAAAVFVAGISADWLLVGLAARADAVCLVWGRPAPCGARLGGCRRGVLFRGGRVDRGGGRSRASPAGISWVSRERLSGSWSQSPRALLS
jgi:hypothetical protein